MPANLSPEYKKAELAYRHAREPRERLECLKEMLRTCPKHKGTEHLQAEIKSRIKEFTDELTGPHKGAVRSSSVHSVRHEGAAQICLIGPPNSGKSSLHALLTGSKSATGAHPHSTKQPIPGMLAFEDIHFQLIDLPPIATDYMEPWIVSVLQGADAALLVVDLSDPACTDHVLAIRDQLSARKIMLSERWPGLPSHDDAAAGSSGGNVGEAKEDVPDPFRVYLPTLLVANKDDLDPGPDEVNVLEELLGVRFPGLATSAVSGHGLDRLGPLLFQGLEIVRVYTKAPGKAADKERPFTVRRSGTVHDVARLVHKDLADTLKFARIWGSGAYDGQQVGPEHAVADGDIVELHAK
jgi:uncharacterized protein